MYTHGISYDYGMVDYLNRSVVKEREIGSRCQEASFNGLPRGKVMRVYVKQKNTMKP